MPKYQNKRTAFTLIELSIVLIVIGLLVAAVAGGSFIVKSAALRSVVSEATSYQVAVKAFYTEYKELPGDYAASLGTNSVAGNDDGKTYYLSDDGIAEGVNAWHQLIESETINFALTVPASGINGLALSSLDAINAGTGMPASKLNNAGWMFDNLAAETTASNEKYNAIVITGNIGALTDDASDQNFVPAGILEPSDAASIDKKSDDGDANTGNIRAHQALTGCFVSDTITNDYDTSEESEACAIHFRVDPLI